MTASYVESVVGNTPEKQPQYAANRAVRRKAAETDRSLSDLVNEAVELSLAEDAEDLVAFAKRAREPNLPFKHLVEDLKRRGKI